jgi:hypothetical protein
MLSFFHLYGWAKGEELYTSKENLLFWGACIAQIFLSDGLIKLDDYRKLNELRMLEGPYG